MLSVLQEINWNENMYTNCKKPKNKNETTTLRISLPERIRIHRNTIQSKSSAAATVVFRSLPLLLRHRTAALLSPSLPPLHQFLQWRLSLRWSSTGAVIVRALDGVVLMTRAQRVDGGDAALLPAQGVHVSDDDVVRTSVDHRRDVVPECRAARFLQVQCAHGFAQIFLESRKWWKTNRGSQIDSNCKQRVKRKFYLGNSVKLFESVHADDLCNRKIRWNLKVRNNEENCNESNWRRRGITWLSWVTVRWRVERDWMRRR